MNDLFQEFEQSLPKEKPTEQKELNEDEENQSSSNKSSARGRKARSTKATETPVTKNTGSQNKQNENGNNGSHGRLTTISGRTPRRKFIQKAIKLFFILIPNIKELPGLRIE